jgi:hypothetical protein
LPAPTSLACLFAEQDRGATPSGLLAPEFDTVDRTPRHCSTSSVDFRCWGYKLNSGEHL